MVCIQKFFKIINKTSYSQQIILINQKIAIKLIYYFFMKFTLIAASVAVLVSSTRLNH
jgi:hypothetical protein